MIPLKDKNPMDDQQTNEHPETDFGKISTPDEGSSGSALGGVQLTSPLDSYTIKILKSFLTTNTTATVTDATISISDITTNNVSVSKHGFAPKAPNDATKFLDGTTAYDTVKDSDLSTSDITTNDVSISKHGFTPKAPNDTSKFLRGDGTWAAPTGSAMVWKFGSSNRTGTQASGTETIAHGFTGTPSYFKITVLAGGSNASLAVNIGTYDGSTQLYASTYTIPGSSGGNALSTSQNGGSKVVFILDTSSTNGQAATVALDATNITLTWAKNGSGLAGVVMQYTWEVWG